MTKGAPQFSLKYPLIFVRISFKVGRLLEFLGIRQVMPPLLSSSTLPVEERSRFNTSQIFRIRITMINKWFISVNSDSAAFIDLLESR